MAGRSSYKVPRNRARKALRDRQQRAQVGEETWQRWKAEAEKDKSFSGSD